MKTVFSIFTLFVLLTLPVAPVAGQDDDTEARCASLRRALACRCLGIDTPDTFVYMRPLIDQEVAEYTALYEELGCAALEATEELDAVPEPATRPKRPAVPRTLCNQSAPPDAAATPDGPACRETVIPDDAVRIQLVEDTRLLWAPDAAAQTGYTVPAGTTAWQIGFDESGEYAALAWTCSVVIYVPVDHTAPARPD